MDAHADVTRINHATPGPLGCQDCDLRHERLDAASKLGPWTIATLDLISKNPRQRAGDLALMLGRDKPSFKLDVRKLKNFGLTISLDVGYVLSPRGEAYLRSQGDG